jgi:hypothetical protein
MPKLDCNHSYTDKPPGYACWSRGCRCDGCVNARKEYARRATQRYREKHPERAKENDRRWRSENRDRCRAAVRRHNKSPRGKARIKKYRIKIRDQIRAKLSEIKLAAGCADCGYNKASEALDFDHVRGMKDFNVCRMATAFKTMQRVLEEVDKCEVVCANCHRIRTKRRKYHLEGT